MDINLILKGIIVGVAKIIPGLSGAVLMISFNLYDRAIDSIVNFFSDVRKNLRFVINFGIGVIIGIIFFSKIINYFISNYYVYTISLFIGLIYSGIPVIKKDIDRSNRGYIILILSFIMMMFISISNINNNYVISNTFKDSALFFLSGIVEAIGTVIPGISSTALLMIIGVYNIYINVLSNLYDISNFSFVFFFGIGLMLGIVFISIVINYLFKNYKSYTFSFVMGISLASILLLLGKVLLYFTDVYVMFISVLLIILGYILGNRI